MALSNTTLGMLLTTINASMVLISLPAIFRGIHLSGHGVTGSGDPTTGRPKARAEMMGL